MRELRQKTASLRSRLDEDEEVVLTANGKPIGLFTAIDPDNLEAELKAVRRARARVSLDRVRDAASEASASGMSTKQVDEVVAAARRQRRRRG